MARNKLCAPKDKKNRWADRQIGLKPQPNSAKMTQFPWKEPFLRVFRRDAHINLRKTSVGLKASNGTNPRESPSATASAGDSQLLERKSYLPFYLLSFFGVIGSVLVSPSVLARRLVP